ncbi:MAG: GTPase [Venatoribacter sp.]
MFPFLGPLVDPILNMASLVIYDKDGVNLEKLGDQLYEMDEQQELLEQKLEQNEQETSLRVAVFGKYNHGKSSLLNALAANGEEYFKVADIRETTAIKTLNIEDICWIDTPGLDADVFKQDDEAAIKAILDQTDLVLFVHALEAGELDGKETELFNQLLESNKDTHKFLLVLNRLDGVTPDQAKAIEKKIASQIKNVRSFKVSTTRYCTGIKNDKEGLVNKSGINELGAEITQQLKSLESFRAQQKSSLKSQVKQIEAKRKLFARHLRSEKDQLEWQMESIENQLQQRIKLLANKVQENNQQYI